MTPSSATGLDEKALEAACAEYFNTSGDSVTQMEAAIRAYMSALTVTSFPPAEQHDVTSHAVPHDGEGAVAWFITYDDGESDVCSEKETADLSIAAYVEATGGKATAAPLFTHPAPVAAQPAEGWVRLPDWEAAHSERLTPEQLHIAGQVLGEYAFGNLSMGYAVSVTVREVGRLIDATPPTAPAVPAGVREALTKAAQLAGDAYWNLPMPQPWDQYRDIYSDWCAAQSARIKDRILALSALPAQPNSSERQKALDAAADLIDGWTTATNTRHLQGWGVHTNAVADMLAKRDAEIATAIRALATNQSNSSEGEPT
jgi:hypothetical protein